MLLTLGSCWHWKWTATECVFHMQTDQFRAHMANHTLYQALTPRVCHCSLVLITRARCQTTRYSPAAPASVEIIQISQSSTCPLCLILSFPQKPQQRLLPRFCPHSGYLLTNPAASPCGPEWHNRLPALWKLSETNYFFQQQSSPGLWASPYLNNNKICILKHHLKMNSY